MTDTGAPPTPLRILVKGSSLVLKVPERAPLPGEYAFPRHVENDLVARGIPVTVWNAGVVGEPTSAAFADWEAQVLAWAPDVIVLGYGYYECIHGFLPHWFERLANPEIRRPGVLRELGRTVLVRPAWKGSAQVQRFWEQRVHRIRADRLRRRVIRRYAAIIDRSRRAGSPLVLVLDLLGPNERAASWFPGMAGRIAAMNDALEAMVAGFADADVRMLSVRALVGPEAEGDPVPDGLHYNPQLRRRIASAIADAAAERSAAIGRPAVSPR
ncbi:MAG: hypothetical protein J7518_09820 [Nocardioidaceae bacterium]|nr:hypothetical protein [Nocardioidaceae bacterium]